LPDSSSDKLENLYKKGKGREESDKDGNKKSNKEGKENNEEGNKESNIRKEKIPKDKIPKEKTTLIKINNSLMPTNFDFSNLNLANLHLLDLQKIESGKKEKVRLEQGLVHVYYGDGRGKTSTALGTALRACGHGMKVKVIQLLKGMSFIGECKAQQKLPNFELEQFGNAAYINKAHVRNTDKELAEQGLVEARHSLASGLYDVVVIDEALYALEFGLIPVEELVSIINSKPKKVELILTGGRNPPKEILELADYVSNIVLEKHPYQKGINARMGIDF